MGQLKNEAFGTDLHPAALPQEAFACLLVPVPQHFPITNKRSIYENYEKKQFMITRKVLKTQAIGNLMQERVWR